MALTDPFAPRRHFQLEQSTEKKDAAKKVIFTNLTELPIHKAWTLFCANTVSCLIMVQVAKVVSLKKDSPCGLKLTTDLMNISKAKTKGMPKSFGQSSKSIKFCATYGEFILYSGFAYAERQTRKIRTEHKSFRFCN